MEYQFVKPLLTVLALRFEPAGDRPLFKFKQGYWAQFFSVVFFQCSDMTETLLKDLKCYYLSIKSY